MFLQKLYRQNKFWFVIVVFFASAQLLINYKHGVEFSPFYHYDMFSLPVTKKTVYEVTEVRVNNTILQAKNFTPNSWDNIVMPVVEYQNEQHWNSLIYNTTIKRLLPASDSSLYVNHLSQQQFNEWYRQRIIRLLKLKDTSATVRYSIVLYHQKNNSLHW